MSAPKLPRKRVIWTLAIYALAQMIMVLSALVPGWLDALLPLPALMLITWLWWDADKQNETNQAFERLVI